MKSISIWKLATANLVGELKRRRAIDKELATLYFEHQFNKKLPEIDPAYRQTKEIKPRVLGNNAGY